ncbi:VOC family protein [Amycolatopsis keratiniphila]|uniref:Glyoxalase n=1 Tax=Amycolatopsis keratiniphila subsp. keratiniphila TaxID=227715 RepID=A0A1W2LPP5_9PSEU|nr:VOC family protein [Amycolatopsis keratiniphila]ONF65619.1 glyoxalase [Amycolatopsis keratiniphila subsp. keratiniphila]
MTETKERPASLHTYLAYSDAPKALRWLERAFGFETTTEYAGDRGLILHSELRRGEVRIIVFSAEEDYDRPARKGETVGHGLYVSLPTQEAVDAVFASAVDAGATTVWKPENTEWGNYRCRVDDLEGYEWTFGTYVPGEPQG